MTDFIAVIPARFESSRLPGKPLADIAGQPMLYWVHRQVVASGASEVIVATDDERIAEAARGFGANVQMTSEHHASGTDRIAELARVFDWAPDRIVVNVQGDEPLIPAVLPRQVADLLAANPDASMATLATQFVDQAEFENDNTAKVILDNKNRALYFSRAPIPYRRDGGWPAIARRHVGIYAYRVDSLLEISAAPPCAIEECERLEQLRAMYLGYRIVVADALEVPVHGVDTEADLAAIRRRMARDAGKA
jgi:3-deoxy-manno-octulosonate cytidylyltransferase (CMP-KDO synthetase)